MVDIENHMKESALREQKERAEINRGIELAIRREIDVSKGQQIRPSKLKATLRGSSRHEQERKEREIKSAYPKAMAKTAEVYLHNGPQSRSMLNIQAKSKTSLFSETTRPQTTARATKPVAKQEKTRPATSVGKKSSIGI